MCVRTLQNREFSAVQTALYLYVQHCIVYRTYVHVCMCPYSVCVSVGECMSVLPSTWIYSIPTYV